MKVAIVHDWLDSFSGAERVLKEILTCYPDSDIYSLVDFLPEADRPFLNGNKVYTSWLQKAPFSKSKFRQYLAFMPYLIEQFDLTEYDLVISSSWAFAKGVLVNATQPHVSYIHTPIRYASAFKHQYLKQANISGGLSGLYIRRVLHQLRQWDANTLHGVDTPIANSNYIAQRIKKTYSRSATVIYPPVEVDAFPLREKKEDYYIAMSRLVPYKRFDILVDAFNKMPDKKLMIVGAGTEYDKLLSAAGPNISMMGYQPRAALIDHVRSARALLMPAEEDFGIVVAEAQAAGTPVLSYSRGGAPEILRTNLNDEPTGLLFDRQDADAVIDAVHRFEKYRGWMDPVACRQNAERFTPANFRQQFTSSVEATLSDYNSFRNQVMLEEGAYSQA